MKYLLLFCTDAQDLAAWQELSEEDIAQKRVQAGQWIHEHRPQIRKSYGLHLPHTVTSVHVGSGGQPLVTDGPFLEGTEVIGGIAEIEVADLDEALHLAKEWSVQAPGYNVVEIWPVVEEQHPHV
ncbi:transcription initiation protein [Ktedonobacter sp. SOSP1-52]|uniref:YciI family protein n=1 Tax=Ktedonobacter sp. SOSP1-52 TaxID=2778366 RepID=UPI001915C746|nr:YciI family protein [Ktedonobacter sp. SOSP1-52]GHO69280.1 transcription initiation protein [Ktedonobacter sp. SOSP1-52]